MSMTQAEILTAVKMQFKRADKDSEIKQGIQYICDDIASVFKDFKGLNDATSQLPLTEDIAYIDVSTELASLYGRRIQKMVIIDSGNSTNNVVLDQDDEIDFVEDYLSLLPDPTNPQSEHKDIPSKYSPYGDYIYFWKVPNSSTLSATIYFGKIHPTVSDTQDILYPADFKSCIVEGVLFYTYKFMERKESFALGHGQLYEGMKDKLIAAHSNRPNKRKKMRCLNL